MESVDGKKDESGKKKQRKNIIVSIKTALIYPGVFISSLVVVILALMISIYYVYTLEFDYGVRLDLVQKLFTSNISQNLLLGQSAVVYGKCKELISEPLVEGVEVRDSLNESICDIQKSEKIKWITRKKSDILFGNSRQKAATVTIMFNMDQLRVQKNSLLVLILVLGLISILIQVIVYRFLGKKIGGPLESLSAVVNSKDLVQIKEYSIFNSTIQVDEVQNLSFQIKEMATEILNFQSRAIEFEAQKGISQLASRVAHDIRSPLSVLTMNVDSISEIIPKVEREYIKGATERINSIAQDLLDRSRLMKINAQAENNLKICDEFLNPIIESIFQEKKMQYRKRESLEFTLDLPDEEIKIKIDRNELQRVISNLVNNSVEAIELSHSGKIKIAVRSYQKQVSIIVSDNGKGMTSECIDKIGKESFSQGKDGSLSGSGIGTLHAVKSVKMMNGHIQFVSKIDYGTVVTLTFQRI